jgi:hypothetical protein
MRFRTLEAIDQSFKTDKIQAIYSYCECYRDHELLQNVTVSDIYEHRMAETLVFYCNIV